MQPKSQKYCSCGEPIITRQGRKIRCVECEAKKRAEDAKARKKRKSEHKPFVLGRGAFASISAVEHIHEKPIKRGKK